MMTPRQQLANNPPPGARVWLRALLEEWIATQTPDATAQQCPCRECGATVAAANLAGWLEGAGHLTDELTQAILRTFRRRDRRSRSERRGA